MCRKLSRFHILFAPPPTAPAATQWSARSSRSAFMRTFIINSVLILHYTGLLRAGGAGGVKLDIFLASKMAFLGVLLNLIGVFRSQDT